VLPAGSWFWHLGQRTATPLRISTTTTIGAQGPISVARRRLPGCRGRDPFRYAPARAGR